ncbi:MAG: hypothetical protein GX494_08705 [Clostridiaceae bacterium]|nr:hypothetical protein [Clostridiaceae bacterium]
MKINEFLKSKKWSIISVVTFLAIFAVIAGLFYYQIDNRVNKLKEKIDSLSSSILELENLPPEIKSSVEDIIGEIDRLSQKPDTDTDDREVDPELLSKFDDILKRLSELSKEIESLKALSETIMQAAQPVEETFSEAGDEIITVPDEAVPGSPADTGAPGEPEGQEGQDETDNPDSTENQTQPENIIKAGQDFIVTVKADKVENLYGYQFNLSYDKNKAVYKGGLKSLVNGINTIFAKDMSDHLLVGATMIGDTPGYTGQDVMMCTIAFTASEDIDPSTLAISRVNTVDAKQNYLENIGGWSIDVKAE